MVRVAWVTTHTPVRRCQATLRSETDGHHLVRVFFKFMNFTVKAMRRQKAGLNGVQRTRVEGRGPVDIA